MNRESQDRRNGKNPADQRTRPAPHSQGTRQMPASRLAQQAARPSVKGAQAPHASKRARTQTQAMGQVQGRHVASPEEQARRAEAYRRAAWGKPEKKRMSRGKKTAIGVVCAVVAVLVAGGTAAALYFNSLNSKLQSVDAQILGVLEKPVSAQDPFYMLVLGSDTREEGAAGRSDTIILARIDPTAQDVTLVSIPRDTQVQIEGYGTQKINAAYAFGGAALAVQTVSEFAGVPIAHVVEIDFFGFKDIVDALGGVTVNVPANTEYQGLYIPEGEQTLNGEQALVFARCRKTYAEGDYQRTKNQRQLVQAVAKKVLNAPVSDMPGLVGSMADAVSTDMSVTELVSLANSMRGMDTGSMKTAIVPSHSGMEDGVSYVFAEEPAWSEMMARVDTGEDPNAADEADSAE